MALKRDNNAASDYRHHKNSKWTRLGEVFYLLTAYLELNCTFLLCIFLFLKFKYFSCLLLKVIRLCAYYNFILKTLKCSRDVFSALLRYKPLLFIFTLERACYTLHCISSYISTLLWFIFKYNLFHLS